MLTGGNMPNNQKQLSSSMHHASVALARIPRNSKSSSRTSSSSNSLNNSSSPPPPTTKRDGFHLVPSHPIQYDIDLTLQLKLLDVTYKISTTDKCARIAFNRPEVIIKSQYLYQHMTNISICFDTSAIYISSYIVHSLFSNNSFQI